MPTPLKCYTACVVKFNSLRTVLFVLLVFAGLATAQSSAPPPAGSTNDPARLIGVWEGRDRSEEGLGETVEFRAGGTLTVTSGMLLNFQGRVIKDELIAMVESLSNIPQEVHIRAAGDRMTYMVAGAPQQWRPDRPGPGWTTGLGGRLGL